MGKRVVLAAALVLALLPWGAEAALPVDPVSGDTVIWMDITVRNEALVPEKNLTVKAGATLTLIDCSLTMNPGTSIFVAPGAALVMRNVTVYCSSQGPLYAFECWGRVDMDGCTVSDEFSWHLDITSGGCSITNCTFEISGTGIGIYNGTPLLRGNRFIAGIYDYYYSPMVHVRDSEPVLECNTFDGNNRDHEGLEVDYPASPLVANNTFRSCSIGSMYYYIHQHGPDGSVSPAARNPALFRGNRFLDCQYGIVTSDSPGGNGMGRSNAGPRALQPTATALVGTNNTFRGNAYAVQANGEAPLLLEGSDFDGNGEGALLLGVTGMRLANDTFSNNSIGVRTHSGGLSVAGCLFNANDQNLVCDNTESIIEGNTFLGGNNTTASLYSYSDITCYFANNTVLSRNAPGLRLRGTGVIFNNTFKECPFGIYRATRTYGQGHGRDVGQGPPAVPYTAIIAGNRFEGNERGIYSEGYSEISDNEFTGNRAGVEASRYMHPADTVFGVYIDTGGPVEELTVERNTFANNSEGVLLLVTNPYGGDGLERAVRDNVFADNTIGVDMLLSEATCTGNDFSKNAGWAFRLFEANPDISVNDFGPCDRAWRQELLAITVLEAPEHEPDTPHSAYVYSNNASVEVNDRRGEPVYSCNMTHDGVPVPEFSVDGFPFEGQNITTAWEFANGSIRQTGLLDARARKPGRGAARETVDMNETDQVFLYLDPTPDIVVSNFTFSNLSATAGDRLAANFTVLNDNTHDPANVSLQDVWVELSLDGALVEGIRIPWLRPGAPEVRRLEWTATAGNHTWTVHADPGGQFRELSTGNNRASVQLDVNGRPRAWIEADRSNAMSGEPFHFSGARSSDDSYVAAFLFDFGDGAVFGWSACATADHSFARAGVYEVRLKVRDGYGLESDWSASWPVIVDNRPPSIRLEAERVDMLTFEPVNFSVLISDAEESAVSVLWDFGDGGRASGFGLYAATHAYADDGTYALRVVASDSDGGVAAVLRNITVRNRPPRASFIASPPEGGVLTRFVFLPAGLDDDGQVRSFLWDLGDGTESTLERPAHRYGRPGSYNVSLTVKDDDGAVSAPYTLAVGVQNSPPVARARLSTGAPRAGAAVTFDATASFDPDSPSLSISWDFGDGTAATGAIVRHAFGRPGNYAVHVRVTDEQGAASEAVIPVTVSDDGPARNEDAGWRTAAAGIGIIALAGAAFLAWVLRNRPKRAARAGPRVVRRVRRLDGTDAYERQLARSRKDDRAPGKDNRSIYDAMQPVRDDGKKG